jgi:hypothetical protein
VADRRHWTIVLPNEGSDASCFRAPRARPGRRPRRGNPGGEISLRMRNAAGRCFNMILKRSCNVCGSANFVAWRPDAGHDPLSRGQCHGLCAASTSL